MSKGKVLVIGSNATRIEVRGGGSGATGQYLNETVVPAMAGGEVSTTPIDFDPFAIEDRELITGQNPRSDHPIAARLIQALDRVTVAA